MTTIITIVVVALVFFVTVCIVAFMVWKREAEMRTDSIKAIEYNVEEMLHELTGASSKGTRNKSRREEFRKDDHEPQHETNDKVEREVNREKVHEDSGQGQAVQRESRSRSEWIENEDYDEGVTVFDPAVMRYASFNRGSHLPERDGRHGLRWKEIQKLPEDEKHQEPAHEMVAQSEPEPTFEPEPAFVEEPQQIQATEFAFVEEPQQVQAAEPAFVEESQRNQAAEFEMMPTKATDYEEPALAHPISYDEPTPAHDETNDEPKQEIYESIDDLLKDYISEPHSTEEEHEEIMDGSENQNIYERYEPEAETHYSETIKPGYDVGKSGRKYTAAELETLIKE